MLRKYTKGHRLEKKRSLLIEKYNNHFSTYIQCIWEILAFPMASSNPSMKMLPKFLSALLSYHCSYISTFQMRGYFQLPQLPSPVVPNIQNTISKISSTFIPTNFHQYYNCSQTENIGAKESYYYIWLIYFYLCFHCLPLSPKILFLHHMLKIHFFFAHSHYWGSSLSPCYFNLNSHCDDSVLAGTQAQASYLSNLFCTCWQIRHCFYQVLAPTTYWTRSNILILTFTALCKISPGFSSHCQSFSLPTFLRTHLFLFFLPQIPSL